MIFDYYGEDINQTEIAEAARTIGPPEYSTYKDELRRAAHFSNASTSNGNEMYENITGYSLRSLGYAAFEAEGVDLTQLKDYVDMDKPLILLMWYSGYHYYGHFRVVTGYNETHVFLHDPWNKPLWNGTYGGPNIAFNYTTFLDLWSYSGFWALYVSPWKIDASMPRYIKPDAPFQVNFTITYPEPLPTSSSLYPASLCNATIIIPQNLSLTQDENQTKSLGTDVFEAGTNRTVSWTLAANHSGNYTIKLEAEGLISGSVGIWVFPAYDYIDRIGVVTNITLELKEDTIPPAISLPSRIPSNEVQPLQEVNVFVNVTDAESEVKNATLYYNLNNGTTWTMVQMSYNSTSKRCNATIPGQPPRTYVRFKIIAYDNVGNNATRDGTEPYFIYITVPEYPSFVTLLILVILPVITALFLKKKNIWTE